MIKITDILSKPVISLIDSKTEGIIKNAIFDKNFKRLKSLILFDNNEYQEEKVLNIQNIYSYGENAIIIKDGQDLNLEVSSLKINDKTLPVNNLVYTYLGKFIGQVTDIVLDDKFYVKSIITNNKEIKIDEVISCGQDAVIIQDDERKVNLSNIKRKKSKKIQILNNKETYNQKVVILNKKEQDEVNKKDDKEEFLDEKNILEDLSTDHLAETLKTDNTTDNLSKIKYALQDIPSTPKVILANTDFLIGRKLEKNIYSQNKELIARKNSRITLEIINKAKMFYKLRELTKYSR